MEVTQSESSVLRNEEALVVYCIEENFSDYIINGAKCFTLRCRLIHFSFVGKLRERRVALIFCPDAWDVVLRQMGYPVCIQVLSCFDFEVNKSIILNNLCLSYIINVFTIT